MKWIHNLVSLSLATSFWFSGLAHADMVNGKWLVTPGDSVYGIARKLFPDDKQQQANFRRQLVKANPEVFKGNANVMSVGSQLNIPEYALPKPEPEVVAEKKPQPVIKLQPPKPEPVPVPAKFATSDPEEIIGKVVINVGELEAVNRGSSRKLHRNSDILKGDTLKTAAATQSQIRLRDGALFSLRPNTELRIAQYQYNGREDGSERSLIELVKGGFRTITGAIGHRNKQNYRVQTSVATIGIRGTHYGLMLCQGGDCQNNNNAMDDGLYGGVVDGSIVIENQSGIHQFNNDQFFRVADINLPPVEVLLPPPVLATEAKPVRRRPVASLLPGDNGLDVPAEATEQPMELKGKPPQMIARGEILDMPRGPRSFQIGPILDPLPPMINTRPELLPQDFLQPVLEQISIYDAPFGSSMNVAFIEPSGTSTNYFVGAPIVVGPSAAIKLGTLNNIGNLPIAGFEESFDSDFGQIVRHEFAIGDPQTNTFALPSNIGGHTLGVNWGRWQGDAHIATVVNGTAIPINHTGDVHFIYSPNLTSLTQLAQLAGLGANVNYTNVAGGTQPTDHLGNAGLIPPSISINADFLTQGINSYTLSVNVGGLGYTSMINDFDGDDIPDFIPFNQLNQSFTLSQQFTGSCTAGAKCIGEASALFIGPNAEGIINSFSVGEPDGTEGISGTALILR